MFKSLEIKSQSGIYKAEISNNFFERLNKLSEKNPFFLLDSNIARLYSVQLQGILSSPRTILVDAIEDNKSIEKIAPLIEVIVNQSVRRSDCIVAIGGGIIQDITCFIATILLRGIEWNFIPTTLLSQADSCIGSKSSINLGKTKNILGTFNPPKQIWIFPSFIDTLDIREIRSGIGEILKVHAIAGKEEFDKLGLDLPYLISDRNLLTSYIYCALKIKKKFIELDEFDKNIRNIFNYGHSFGHAIESATNFLIPHGVAVSIGMDMANYVSLKRGMIDLSSWTRMHKLLYENYFDFVEVEIPKEAFHKAIMKDKKNTKTQLALILPAGDLMEISRVYVNPDSVFALQCEEFLRGIGANEFN